MQKVVFVHVFVWCLLVTMIMVFLAWSVGPVTATNRETSAMYQYVITPTAPVPGVLGYIVLDEETGGVLLSLAPDVARPTASVIKLIVAAAALRSELLEATTTITESDVAAPEDFGKLAVGEVYTLRELLFPYLIESSNDAGVAIERTWGEELSPIIAEVHKAAGVSDSIMAADFNGLSHETVATPAALAHLTKSLAKTTPTVFDITKLPQYVGQHPLANNSPFIVDKDYQGGKHGYTPEAGKTAVVRFRATYPDGERTLIAVLLGTEDNQIAFEAIKTVLRESVTRVPQSTEDSAIIPAT
jgi:D-alanyl-D-alanine carboxypeptidase (penicillin-binding protein 5/6)